jgi:hypothetical protein
MDVRELKERYKKMTDAELEYNLCDLESIRITMVDVHGASHSIVNELNIELDTIAGEMIRRDDAKRNGPEPKPETPKAPNTYYQLMSLGNGELS